jgi:ABC-type branched-subunit amino acid transport system ATPase component
VIVLAMPGGIAALIDFRNRRPLAKHRAIVPRPDLLGSVIGRVAHGDHLKLTGIVLAFGGVRAIDGVDLDVAPGQVHGLIGPNGSGKTTTLNVISGYYTPEEGTLVLGASPLPQGAPQQRAGFGIARTFQTPRIVGEASVLQNVMIGGGFAAKAGFLEALLWLPRQRSDERALADAGLRALAAVGLESLAHVRADRLQHSELRFVEIARALMLKPAVLLLDEPAAGLSPDEIERLGALIKAVSRQGTAVLLVEHHADLIFDICDHVTVLNLGKVLASGTPADIRAHKEVVSAYLGA